MKQITSAEFKKAVDLDPAWATTLTEPVEITDYCHMVESKITHLSPLLHFVGRNKGGDVAGFSRCANLKVAQGTFHGFVTFNKSGIEAIDPNKLIITRPDSNGYAASFTDCTNLKVAQGTFPGLVWFSESGIEKIDPEKLVITQPDTAGDAAYFNGCKNLKVAQGTFPGFVAFITTGIEEIDPNKLVITQSNNNGYASNFFGCKHLKVAQGTFPGRVDFSGAAIEKIGKLEFKGLYIQTCTHLKSCPENYLHHNEIEMDEELRVRLTQEKKARDLFRQHKKEPIPEI